MVFVVGLDAEAEPGDGFAARLPVKVDMAEGTEASPAATIRGSK